MPENRRVRMTKKLMQDALVELLENKPLAKISVTDVCAAADVNRSTFYAYYQDVAGLLREVEDETIAKIPDAPSDLTYYEVDELLDIFERYFAYVKDNARLFRVLNYGTGSPDFHRRLMEKIMGNFNHAASSDADTITRYGYIYAISGTVGLMKEWIDEGFPLTPRQFSKLMIQMAIQANRIHDEEV